MHALHRLREQVVVLCSLQGHVNACLRGELASPQSRGEHDGVGVHIAVVGGDARDAIAVTEESGDEDPLGDGGAS